MSEVVWTTKGDVPRDELTYRDTVTETADEIVTAREWFHGGEFCRRDVWVDKKRGWTLTGDAGF